MSNTKKIQDILLTKVNINMLGKTITHIQNNNKNENKSQTIQIFELLVAETLNLYDDYTSWEVTRAIKDGGIDLYGTSKKIIITPFTNERIEEISLGQVKHTRNTGYGVDKIKDDINKMKNAWLRRDNPNNCTLRQYLFVLATSNDNYVDKLDKEIKKRSQERDIADLKDYANITLLDGNKLMKSWKLNFSYFEDILKKVLPVPDLNTLKKFVYNQSDEWLNINLSKKSFENESYYVGEPFTIIISVTNSMPYINTRLYLKWRPDINNAVQILYPLNAADTRTNGVPLSKTTDFVQGQSKEFVFVFRGIKAGEFNLGSIDLCYEKNKTIKSILLDKVNFLSGILFDDFKEPTQIQEYNELKAFIKRENWYEDNFKCVVFTGCGGAGKSTLISELIYSASGNGFSCISIQQPKDKVHEREIIIRLINKLSCPNTFLILKPRQVVQSIMELLRGNFDNQWEQDLLNYLSGDNRISEKIIAECLATLIITISANTRLLIWLSDLHWGSQELFSILGETLDILERHKDLFENRVTVLLEGRDGETLRTKNFLYSPDNWLNFLENGFLHIINLPLWTRMECEEFLKTKFSDILNKETANFINQTIQSSNSVPMHIVQNINLMLENKILSVDDNRKLIILKAFDKQLFSDSIIETINNRIDFYERKFKIYIELLVIVAKWNDKVNTKMNDWIIDKLNLTTNKRILIKQSGFIEEFSGFDYKIKFRHEHFLTAFGRYNIKNDKLVDECIRHYCSLSQITDDDKLKIIELKKLLTYKDYDDIYNDSYNLLLTTKNNNIKLSAYKIIEEIQDKVSVIRIPKYKVCFEICELILRNGNWNESLKYLDKVLIINEDSIECNCYRLKSYQEYANIQADRLFFDDSIEKAESGIKLADECLANVKFCNYIKKICLLKEKLQARLAVCYWFSGDFKTAYKIQKNCLMNACTRGDSYSSAHISYEIATLEFHWLYNTPAKKMKKILSTFNTQPIPYLEHEKSLIEIQLLIGEVIYSIKNNQDVTFILCKTDELIDLFRLQPKIYEEFLCRTIRAICFFYQKNYPDCLKELTYALNKSTYSNMPNLEWKAYVNIAQFLNFEGNKNCKQYAWRAVEIFSGAINSNKNTVLSFKKMINPVVNILENILQKTLPEFGIDKCEDQNEMLATTINGVTFFIMN